MVDLPLDSFCEVIEIQIHEIDARRKRTQMNDFVENSTTVNGEAEKDVLLPQKMKSSFSILQEHKTVRKDILPRSSSQNKEERNNSVVDAQLKDPYGGVSRPTSIGENGEKKE